MHAIYKLTTKNNSYDNVEVKTYMCMYPTANGMVWYGVVWRGVTWRGVAWHGMSWYGMVWYGIIYLVNN